MPEQNRIAFGYNRNEINRIIINETQALTVKLIFELYAEGKSLDNISRQLAACEIPSPYNNPKWGKQALSKILSYERYHGTDDYPKIIDQELYDRVLEIRQSRAK